MRKFKFKLGSALVPPPSPLLPMILFIAIMGNNCTGQDTIPREEPTKVTPPPNNSILEKQRNSIGIPGQYATVHLDKKVGEYLLKWENSHYELKNNGDKEGRSIEEMYPGILVHNWYKVDSTSSQRQFNVEYYDSTLTRIVKKVDLLKLNPYLNNPEYPNIEKGGIDYEYMDTETIDHRCETAKKIKPNRYSTIEVVQSTYGEPFIMVAFELYGFKGYQDVVHWEQTFAVLNPEGEVVLMEKMDYLPFGPQVSKNGRYLFYTTVSQKVGQYSNFYMGCESKFDIYDLRKSKLVYSKVCEEGNLIGMIKSEVQLGLLFMMQYSDSKDDRESLFKFDPDKGNVDEYSLLKAEITQLRNSRDVKEFYKWMGQNKPVLTTKI